MEGPTEEHEYDLPVWRYKSQYIRSWFQWRMFLQNVATCVLGIYYIGWRVRLLVFKVTKHFRRY